MRARFLLSSVNLSMNLWTRSYNILKQGIANLRAMVGDGNTEDGGEEGNEGLFDPSDPGFKEMVGRKRSTEK